MSDKTKDTKKVVSLKAIMLSIFPSFSGDREKSSYRAGNNEDKFVIELPVPQDNEQALKFYNRSMDQILRLGLKQIAYGVNKTVDRMREAIQAGQDPRDPAYTKSLAKQIEADLFWTPPASSEKAAERKLKDTKAAYLDQLLTESGVDSVEELKAKIAKMKK